MQRSTLGRYRIVKELGHGAMGRVFLAHDPEIDREVAIKVLHAFERLPNGTRAEARQRFLTEARSAGKLLHPGIVTVFDAGQAGDALYMAMEYVRGQTLARFCDRGNLLPVQTAVQLVATAAEALDYAHQSGIVHGDIKPANLMRTDETSVKVMDFGLARPPRGEISSDGSLLGTPSYMSPEQIRGEETDGRSDLFALGVVLYELLTGEQPFPGESVSSVIYRIVNEDPPDPTGPGSRVDAELWQVLRRVLAKKPSDRYPTGSVFAAALREAVALPAIAAAVDRAIPDSAPTAAEPSPRRPPERQAPPRSSPLPFVMGLVVLLGAIGYGAYHFRDALGFERPPAEAEIVWWETTVRTEPPGIEVALDGAPIDPIQAGVVQFRSDGPFGVLSASYGCREIERAIEPTDAGSEVVLVFDPIQLSWPIDTGVETTDVRVNGERVGKGLVEIELDLCRDNRVDVSADGYRGSGIEIPAGASPMEARTLLADLSLAAIPRGTLEFPEASINLVRYVDGRRLRSSERSVELAEGEYEVRIKNEHYWIDLTKSIKVFGGQVAVADIAPPPLTDLVVQAYPANCKVFLRRPGGEWKYVDDTPLRRQVAVGSYEVRVQLNPTGETREQTVDLTSGANPPVRVSFGGSR